MHSVVAVGWSETLIVGPFKSLRELEPDDAVKPEEKKKGDAPRAS